jgi:uncharacterized protein (DUF2267 family)
VLKTTGKQEQQRTLRIGSEVRFADGAMAGRVRALNNHDFLVIRGKKRIRRLLIPYSSIEVVGNRIVTLRIKRAEASDGALRYSAEKEGLSKKNFVRELDDRLALDNPERTERIIRIVLYLLSKRLSPEKKKNLKKSLPLGIRSLWAAVEQPGTGQYFTMSDFLIPVRKQGRFQTMEEAFIVTREVFACLQRIMPAEEGLEISRSLPFELKEIWQSANIDPSQIQI